MDKEVINMENIGVTCDVCACCQQVETPHYCQSYEEK